MVQEFINGHDLTQEIPLGQKLGGGETLELLNEILSVLSFVHQNGVIHRNIKPENIMRRERDGKLFLIDFGAVKEINVMTGWDRAQFPDGGDWDNVNLTLHCQLNS